MIEYFLRAKHWQLFLFTFGIPLILQIAFTVMLFMSLFLNEGPDMAFIGDYFAFFPFLIILFAGVFFAWFWSVGIGLNQKTPTNANLNKNVFKLLLIAPFIYLILALILVFNITLEEGSDLELKATLIIIPLHLVSMGCIFYCMAFIARTIKSIELERNAHFSDYFAEFFLIWFYPIGIWILQPRINKIFSEMDH